MRWFCVFVGHHYSNIGVSLGFRLLHLKSSSPLDDGWVTVKGHCLDSCFLGFDLM